MPPAPLTSISLLAAGALAGAGAAALFGRDKKEVAVPPIPVQPAAPSPPPSSGKAGPVELETDLMDRRLLALAAQRAGGAIESSGYPGPISDLLTHTAYVSAYDRKLRHPAWTASHMTAESLLQIPRPDGQKHPKANRQNSVFKEDERIPDLFRAKLADYFRSGYDRGHMVAAADAKFSQKAMDETFLLTNIAPQVGEGFNRDYWAHTEDFVRRLTSQFADVYVFTVPLYLPKKDADGKFRVHYEVIGNPPAVSVPTHFAKVVLGVGKPRDASTTSAVKALAGSSHSGDPQLTPRGAAGNLIGEKWVGLGAFVIPNAIVPNSTPLKSFVVPVESVERAAGLNLFPSTVKSSAKQLCSLVDCSIIVRDFSDASKRLPQRSQSAPGGLSA
ncbi:unnamed protein product [Sympodiomycopsis kandeliae]